MNKTAKKEFMGALRHKDPLLCTQGALAQLLFWRWHIAGEEPPSFRHRKDWYMIKVLVGQHREHELSYSTQLKETWRIFGLAGIISPEKTRLPRKAGAQNAEIHGSTLSEISQTGGWNQTALCQTYLTHLRRRFLRLVAGFSESGDYFLPRAVHEPPAILQKQLWPWIEKWEPRFEARARRQSWAEGGLDEDDLAADGFLKLMRRLRIVLLQDLAIIQPRYPGLPFFSYAPFHGPDWDDFAQLVRANVTEANEPQSLLLQRALPELSDVLKSSHEAVLHSLERIGDQVKNEFRDVRSHLAALQSSLDALLRVQIPITTMSSIGTELPAAAAAAVPAARSSAAAAPAPDSLIEPNLPVITALPRVYTVEDVWREWTIGLPGGQPAFRELEKRWGSRWRPGNATKVQFCRRKIILDAIRARTIQGRTEEEAIAELELLRAGRGLNQLVEELRRRRQQPLEDPKPRRGTQIRRAR
jgi:hypothetical protein